MKVSQSIIDAVKSIMEAGWDKEQTPTGTKVYGSSYGDSKKARKDQTKSSVDTMKEPKKKDLEENADDITRPEVKDIADKEAKKEVKKHEKNMHHKESFASRLVSSHYETELVEAQIQEVLSKDASAGDWISDFVHSDDPKFKGKSKTKRKQMALAAYYAKQRNEEVEQLGEMDTYPHPDSKEGKELSKAIRDPKSPEVKPSTINKTIKTATKVLNKQFQKSMKKEEVELEEELKGKQYKLDKNKNGKLDSDDFKKLRNEAEDCSCDDEGHEDEKEDKDLVKKMVKKTALKTEAIDPKNDKDYDKPAYLRKAAGVKLSLKDVRAKDTKAKDDYHARLGLKQEEIDPNVRTKDMIKGRKPSSQKDDVGPGSDGKSTKVKFRGGPIGEAKQPEQDNVPFAPPYTKGRDDVTDKSGAVHTPMSRAKDLARTAMKRIKTEMLGKAPGNN